MLSTHKKAYIQKIATFEQFQFWEYFSNVPFFQWTLIREVGLGDREK